MAQIDEQFQTVIDYLIKQQKASGNALLNGGARTWQDFVEVADVDRFDFEKQATIFSREKANALYETLHAKDTGLAKEVQAVKQSSDVLAGLERDFRMRTRTRIRMFVHSANRNAGNGLAKGPLKVNTIGYVTRLLGEDKVEKEADA